MSALRSIRILDPLAYAVLHNEGLRRVSKSRKYVEPGYAVISRAPWNSLRSKLELHLCDSVKEMLETAPLTGECGGVA